MNRGRLSAYCSLFRSRITTGLGSCFQKQTKRSIAFLVLCLLAITSPQVAAGEQPDGLLIGIEPEHNIFDQMVRYRSLAAYLSEQLGLKVNLTIMSRYGEVLNRFKTLRLDGAFLTSYTTTLGINELNLVPLANPVNLNGESTSRGYIFVRRDSGISDLKDMQNKSMIFVDPATTEGYLFPLAYLTEHGVADINTFFSRISYSGSHASAIFAVLDGRADIGAAKDTVYNRLIHNDPSIEQELSVFARSSKVPEITFCMKKDIDEGLREKLREILLNMDKTPQGTLVLKQFEALRFVNSSPSDFDRIKEMALETWSDIAEHGKD